MCALCVGGCRHLLGLEGDTDVLGGGVLGEDVACTAPSRCRIRHGLSIHTHSDMHSLIER